nr:ethanolamine ammonia-lyase reactivating factor EutA [Desulfitibacter alkalitolerans]
MTSVGIDIGTTTTQLVISRLTIKNSSPGAVIPKMEIADKEIVYRSSIHFTPINEHQLIDAQRVKEIIETEYRQAGIKKEEVETGAVIITGETAKKENAKSILEATAGFAGDFVVATAGVNLESILAGKGSGAAKYSKENHKTVANIDVGGGTSNIGVFKGGRTLDTACINIGGHLIELEKNSDRITYIAEPARLILNDLSLPLRVGDRITQSQLVQIAIKMAEAILETITKRNMLGLADKLMMTPPLKTDYTIEKVMISGGVADYVYNDYRPVSVTDITKYGDIGPVLGWAIRETFAKAGIDLVKPLETIRATVIGAGIHSLEISGSTIHVNSGTLPMRNITVISPFPEGVPEKAEDVARLLKSQVHKLTIQDRTEQNLAISLKEPYDMSFNSINELAHGIARGMEDYLTLQKPIIVVIEADCGKVLGQCLSIILKGSHELVCIDQIQVDEGDYIDIGKPVMGGRVVPVVVKTLVFEKTAH